MEDDIRHFVLNRQAAVISELGFLAINLNPRLQGGKLFVNLPSTRRSGRLPEPELARRLQDSETFHRLAMSHNKLVHTI
jgi:hypothetical protein